MEISNNGLKFLLKKEGFRSCPYWDPYGKVWTRGIGETEGISRLSRCITLQEGISRAKDIFNARYAWALKKFKLNQNQYDALASFIWNLGPGSMQWDVGQSLKEGKYLQAADQMLQYNRSNGVVLEGLTRRREEERKLFLTPSKQSNLLNVLYPNERKAINKNIIFNKHPSINYYKIKKIKEEIRNMRANVYDAAEFGKLRNGVSVKKGWNINNRRARYEILRKYSL